MSGIGLPGQLVLFLPDTRTIQSNIFTASVEGVLSLKFAKKLRFTIEPVRMILYRYHLTNLYLFQIETYMIRGIISIHFAIHE